MNKYWSNKDTSTTGTVARTGTVKLFKHACKWILRFYKWPELMWQHNYCNGDTQKVPMPGSEPVTDPSGCLPEVCKCTRISRGNLIWQFFKPKSSEILQLSLCTRNNPCLMDQIFFWLKCCRQVLPWSCTGRSLKRDRNKNLSCFISQEWRIHSLKDVWTHNCNWWYQRAAEMT